MTQLKKIVLAIECAVGPTAAAVFVDGSLASSVRGVRELAKADELTQVVSEALANAFVEPSHITRIAISNGPGSYTGIRTGLAFALGLAAGSSAEITHVPVTLALAADLAETGKVASIVKVGKGNAAIEVFIDGEPNHLLTVPLEDLSKAVATLNVQNISADARLREFLLEAPSGMRFFTESFAAAIGRYAISSPYSDPLPARYLISTS